MRNARTAILGGVAALALAGTAGVALAGTSALHTMTVEMPGGGTAHIEYSGKVAPKVTFGTAPFAAGPFAAAFFGPNSPFAAMDRISAAMNRQMDSLMQATWAAPMWAPNGLLQARLGNAPLKNAPKGAEQYSFVSTFGGNGNFCTRSMEMTSRGAGTKPHVVTHSSGNCGGMNAAVFGHAPTAAPATQDVVYRTVK
jgi:hypothetical protein